MTLFPERDMRLCSSTSGTLLLPARVQLASARTAITHASDIGNSGICCVRFGGTEIDAHSSSRFHLLAWPAL